MTLPTPKALLFDWDNTLVDSWVVIHHALSATFRAMDREPWTLEETRERVRKSARDSFPELFGDRAEEAMAIFYGTYESDHLAQLSPRSGAASMLEDLAAMNGLVLGVVSNKKGELLRKEAAHLGWDRLFVSVVGATDAARDKPAPEGTILYRAKFLADSKARILSKTVRNLGACFATVSPVLSTKGCKRVPSHMSK